MSLLIQLLHQSVSKIKARKDDFSIYRGNSDSSMYKFFDMYKRNRVQRSPNDGEIVFPSLDLGDRLVEKLNEQRHEREAKIGNLTCVLKHMGWLNNENELDLAGMREEMKQE